MPNIQEILKQIQRDMSCPICGTKFELKDIKIRGQFDHALVIQTMCTDGHLTIIMTIFKKQDKIPVKAIATDEVLDFSNCLNNFKGDFEKLWKK